MKLAIYNKLWKSIMLLFVFLLISCIPVTPLPQDIPVPSLQSTTLNQTPSISPTYPQLPPPSKTPPAEPISAELGTLGWVSHTSLPVKSFQKFWGLGYNILSLAYGDGLWVATLNKDNDFNDQKILVSENFPEKDIEEARGRRYYVTNVAYGDGLWAIVLSNTDEINDQLVKVDTEFSPDKIAQMTEDGYWLTNLAYGDGVWAIICTKTDGIASQKILVNREFPRDELEQNKSKGMFLTAQSQGDETWILVVSATTGLKQQEFVESSFFAKDFIIGIWDRDGYDNIKVFYGNNTWFFIGEK